MAWSTPPTFADGDDTTLAANLNTVVANNEFLHGIQAGNDFLCGFTRWWGTSGSPRWRFVKTQPGMYYHIEYTVGAMDGCTIRYSTNLTSWTTLATLPSGVGGDIFAGTIDISALTDGTLYHIAADPTYGSGGTVEVVLLEQVQA